MEDTLKRASADVRQMSDTAQSEILPKDGGRWLIETVSGSRHLFDLDEMMYSRLSGGVNIGGNLDSEELHEILEIQQMPRVNSMFRVALAVSDPDLAQMVVSSFVTRITALANHEGLTVELPTVTLLEQVAQVPPVNAWLLLGDEASFPNADDLRAQRDSLNPDLWNWTCPRQIQRGDLVFIYFMAPHKAVHFVARALFPPVYDPSISVNALKKVDPHQWWTDLSPFVEVPPLPFSRLKELHGGHLVLRGKPTHYLPPDVVDGIVADLGDLDKEQRLVLQRPVGDPMLPEPEQMQLDDLRRISAGLLQPEAMVEQYIVEPMLRMCFPESGGNRVERQLKIPGAGVADFGIHGTEGLLGVVEVKIGVRRQPHGGLKGSPDLAQVLRYAEAARVPGLLIDANEVFLVEAGHDESVSSYERQHLTSEHLSAIAAHVRGR
jgi:hypothetical protein